MRVGFVFKGKKPSKLDESFLRQHVLCALTRENYAGSLTLDELKHLPVVVEMVPYRPDPEAGFDRYYIDENVYADMAHMVGHEGVRVRYYNKAKQPQTQAEAAQAGLNEGREMFGPRL